MEAKVIEWQTKLVELSNAKDKVRHFILNICKYNF
jgi:hypothetical protein